jgi:hypothetical protein
MSERSYADVKIPKEYELTRIVEKLLSELLTKAPLDKAAVDRIVAAGRQAQ